MIPLTNLNMEEPEIIELSSDSDEEMVDLVSDSDDEDEDEDDDGIFNHIDANVHNYRTVTIIGPPVAMPRPAFMSWMKKATLFRRVVNKASPKIKAFRDRFIEIMRQEEEAIGNRLELPLIPEGAVCMEILFHRRMPNSAFTNRQRWRPFVQGRFNRDLNWEDTRVPDIDNLAKFVLDALNGVVYKDDGQVCKLVLYKLVDNQPPCDGRTIIRFKELIRFHDLPQPPNPDGVVQWP